MGLSREALSKKSGVAAVSIGQYERGERTPRIEQLKSIATALGVGVNVLLYGKKDGNSRSPFWTDDLDEKLKQVGYNLGFHHDTAYGEYYQWINFLDGTLEVTDVELKELHDSSNEYLRFKLEELRKRRIQDFKQRKE